MAHEVFISYATEDREVADKVCDALERGGVRCWIAPRDVPVGVDYEEAIMDGIASSRMLVLVLSSHSNASPHVKREIQNASVEGSQTQIIPLRIEDIEYNKALRYYLGSAQWLDASTPPLEQHLGRLVEHVRSRLLRAGDAARPVESSTHVNPPDPARDYDSLQRTTDGRKPFPFALVGAGVLALLLVAVVVAFVAMRGGRDNRNTLPVNNANVNNATPTPQRTPTPSPTPSASPTPSPRPPIRNVNRTTLNFNLRRPLNRNN